MKVVAVSIDSGRVLWVTATLVESSCLADAYCLPDRIHHAVVDGYPLTALDRKVLQIGLKELGLPHGDDAAIGHSVGRLNVSFVPKAAIIKFGKLLECGMLEDGVPVRWNGLDWVEFDGRIPDVKLQHDVKVVNTGVTAKQGLDSSYANADNTNKDTSTSLNEVVCGLWESGYRESNLFNKAKETLEKIGLSLPDHKLKVKLFIFKKQKEG